MSRILKTVHESVKSLYELKVIDKTTLHEFDQLCVEPLKKMSPQTIKKLRLREHVSQPVFATLLNVSASAVKKWETGEQLPSGATLRLLEIVDRNGLNIITQGVSIHSNRNAG